MESQAERSEWAAEEEMPLSCTPPVVTRRLHRWRLGVSARLQALKSGTWKLGTWKLALPVVCALLAAAGCGALTAPTEQRHLPPPVTDHGMTLDWGADVKTAALDLINHSRQYCYLDIYELSDPDILSALAAAHARGVDVRVIVDATESHSQQDAVPTLRREGVPVASLHISHGISHIKMLATDGGALLGGMNFGAHSWDNNDASVSLGGPNDSFVALFRWDWERAHHEPAEQPSLRAPLVTDRDIHDAVLQAITHARREIDMEAFNLSDWGVEDALTAAARRGVQVQVLLDPEQSQNRSSAAKLRAAGATVRFYKPYGNEWMHAKIVDVDDGAVFIIGSANFSHQAYTYNHEGDLVLTNVPAFHRSLLQNLSAELARGTSQPVRHSGTTDGQD